MPNTTAVPPVIATYTDTFFSAYQIHAIDHDEDRVLASFNNSGTVSRPTWRNVYYNRNGDPYYMDSGRRLYLANFSKTTKGA